MDIPRFHLAFPILDLEATRSFYHGLLGCEPGRESDRWIDFNFFGHQITGHLVPGGQLRVPVSEVDGKGVPIPHFGAILDWEAWQALAEKLKVEKIPFLIEPHIRFPGEVAEQATLFIQDPSGNGVEFKAFKDLRCAWARGPLETVAKESQRQP
jgi:extradiol dioxygenase family protein